MSRVRSLQIIASRTRSLSSIRRPSWSRPPNQEDSPRLLYAIVGVNGAVYLAWNNVSDWQEQQFMLNNFTMSERGITREGRFHTILTHFFSHKDGFHILANMFTLWSFGQEALLLLGERRFLALYMGGGLVSAAASLVAPKFLDRAGFGSPFGQRYSSASSTRSLGASGAVNAVVLWSIFSNPMRGMMIFPIPIALPSWVFGLGFVAWDMFSAANRPNSHVGHTAHLGGAAWGVLYYAWSRGRGGRW